MSHKKQSVQRPSPVTTPARASGPSAPPVPIASSSATSTPDDIPFGVFLLSFNLSAAEMASVTRWAAARGISDDIWRQPLKKLISRPVEWQFAPLSRRTAEQIEAEILPRNSVERVLMQRLPSVDDVAFVLQHLRDHYGIEPTESATHKAMQTIALGSFFTDIGVVDAKNALRSAFFAPDSIECLLLRYGVPAERVDSVVERCHRMGLPSQGTAVQRALRLLFARDEALIQRDLGLTGADLRKLQNLPQFDVYPISCALALHSDWRAAYAALCELCNFDVDEDAAADDDESDSPRAKLQQLMLQEEEWLEVDIDRESRELLESTLSDPAAVVERERKRLENEEHRRDLSEFLSGVATTDASTSSLRAAVEALLEGEYVDWEARLASLLAHGMLDEFEPDALRAALLEHTETGCGVPMCDNNAAVMLRCGHALCEECVQGIVKAKIGEQVVLIKCIGEKNCPEVIPHATIKRVLSLRDWERFESISQSVALSSITSNHYCVNKSCTNAVDVGEFRANGNRRWVCDLCTHDQCIECVCSWHEEMTCEQYQKAVEERASEERLSEAAIKAMPTKMCPKCQRHKHYDGHQCAHVTCDCSAQWYWCCQRTYNARVGSEEQRLHNMLCCSNKWCFTTFKTATEQRAHTDTCKPPAASAQPDKPP